MNPPSRRSVPPSTHMLRQLQLPLSWPVHSAPVPAAAEAAVRQAPAWRSAADLHKR